MTLTRIAVDRCVRFLSKCRLNLRLCSLGNELILFGHMHEKGRMKPIDLSQIFLSIGAVIPDRGVQVQQNGSSVWIELPDWRNSFAGARQSVRSPILFITAHEDAKMRIRAMREGAGEFFSKPFDHHLLLKSSTLGCFPGRNLLNCSLHGEP